MKTNVPVMLAALIWFGSYSSFAQSWTQVNSLFLYTVASSANGQNLVAAVGGGPIYVTTNSGAVWMQTSAPIALWNSVASSADGCTLVAAVGGAVDGGVYTSTNSGLNWVAGNVPSGQWNSVASSADGAKFVACGVDFLIYTSTNSGISWFSNNTPCLFWLSVASSADGAKLAAIGATDSSEIYTSTNSGATWALSTTLPSPLVVGLGQCSIASSADGTELVAAVSGQGIYISTNSGATWLQNTAPNIPWEGVACSSDGTTLVAVSRAYLGTGQIYVSTDSGNTWVSNSASVEDWTYAAVSADGKQLVATGDNGVYISQSIPSPILKTTLLGGNLVLSWTVPSANFVLRQNSDLTVGNWTDVTNSTDLNLTNLEEQVVLSPTNICGFYRLATP
jgi:hypothetical protein